jgi:PhnB protein
MRVQPSLFFDGRCEEGVEFSHKTLGTEVTLRIRFQESSEPPQLGMVPPGSAHKVVQTSVRMGAMTVLASDGPCGGRPSVQGFALLLTVPDEAKAEQLFAALADGGLEHLPLTTTFFVPRFGMVADRFGVSERVTVAPCVPVPPQEGERTGEAQ